MIKDLTPIKTTLELLKQGAKGRSVWCLQAQGSNYLRNPLPFYVKKVASWVVLLFVIYLIFF